MIGIRTLNDVLSGTITLYDNSVFTDVTFSRALIEIPTLGLSKELNSGSTPTIGTFLSPNSVIGVTIPSKVDNIVTLKYTLLSSVNPSGLSYSIGDNKVYQAGIYNLFSGTNYIYINKLYLIDKSLSTDNSLWLTEIIEESGSVYLAYHVDTCATSLFNIPKELKKLSFSFNGQCLECKDSSNIMLIYQYLTALEVRDNCNTCDTKKILLRKIKKLLSIC